jgi:hypothetical protein
MREGLSFTSVARFSCADVFLDKTSSVVPDNHRDVSWHLLREKILSESIESGTSSPAGTRQSRFWANRWMMARTGTRDRNRLETGRQILDVRTAKVSEHGGLITEHGRTDFIGLFLFLLADQSPSTHHT